MGLITQHQTVVSGGQQSSMNDMFLGGVMEAARVLQVPPGELLAIISFETGGTMDPMQSGPTTQWGTHRGLIQFGEPQAEEYGVDFSSPQAALMSQLGPSGAIVKYALAHGFIPGQHGAADLYSTINAGGPGRMGASDAHNGGTSGTVADKFNTQMQPHRERAYAMLGGEVPPPGSVFSPNQSGYRDYGTPPFLPDPEWEAEQQRRSAWLDLGDGISNAAGGGARQQRIMQLSPAPTTTVPMVGIPEAR